MNRKHKKPQWKKVQDKKILQKKRNQWLLGIGFLSFLSLLILGGLLYKKAKFSIWDGISRLGMVKQDESKIMLEILLPKQDRLIKIELPFDLVVEVPFGYGEYQLEKIYRLGELDEKGGELLTRTTQDLMGLSVKGYQYNKQTNLTWWDKLRISWFKMKANKNINLSLIEEIGLIETILADGSKTLEPSEILIDEFINQYLFDELIVNEGMSVTVLNASGVDNLATKTARIINNLGGQVSIVSNQEENNQSELWLRDKSLLNSMTTSKLKSIFNIEVIKVFKADEYRSDLVLVISKDYSQLK
jgi:hypothetical protein